MGVFKKSEAGPGRVWVEQSLVLQAKCLRGQPKCTQGQRGPWPSERGRGNREQHNPVRFMGSCKTPLGTTRTISWGWQVGGFEVHWSSGVRRWAEGLGVYMQVIFFASIGG